MGDFVQVHLELDGQDTGRLVDLNKLPRLAGYLDTSLVRSVKQIQKELRKKVLDGYRKLFYERPRTEGEHLRRRLLKALAIQSVTSDSDSIEMLLFDLDMINRLTMNEGRGTEKTGWFFFFEDGHVGRAHGGRRTQHAFIPLKVAIMLAEEAADWKNLNQSEKADFLVDMRKAFQGRHGEGIMVDLDDTVFYRYPEFGTWRDRGFTQTHPGYEAWNYLYHNSEFGQATAAGRSGGSHWITDSIHKAVTDAVGKVLK